MRFDSKPHYSMSFSDSSLTLKIIYAILSSVLSIAMYTDIQLYVRCMNNSELYYSLKHMDPDRGFKPMLQLITVNVDYEAPALPSEPSLFYCLALTLVSSSFRDQSSTRKTQQERAQLRLEKTSKQCKELLGNLL